MPQRCRPPLILRSPATALPRSLYYPDGRYVGIVEWNETGPWSEVVGPWRRVAARRA